MGRGFVVQSTGVWCESLWGRRYECCSHRIRIVIEEFLYNQRKGRDLNVHPENFRWKNIQHKIIIINNLVNMLITLLIMTIISENKLQNCIFRWKRNYMFYVGWAELNDEVCKSFPLLPTIMPPFIRTLSFSVRCVVLCILPVVA